MTDDEYNKRAQAIVREEFEAATQRIAKRAAELIAEKLASEFLDGEKLRQQGGAQWLKH